MIRLIRAAAAALLVAAFGAAVIAPARATVAVYTYVDDRGEVIECRLVVRKRGFPEAEYYFTYVCAPLLDAAPVSGPLPWFGKSPVRVRG